MGTDAEQSTITTSDRTGQGRLGNHWSLITQAFVQIPEGRRGRPFREEQDLPQQIQQALIVRPAGASWIDCADGASVDVCNLRNWRKHPQAEPFLNEQIRGNLQQAQTVFPKLRQSWLNVSSNWDWLSERRDTAQLLRLRSASRSCKPEWWISSNEGRSKLN